MMVQPSRVLVGTEIAFGGGVTRGLTAGAAAPAPPPEVEDLGADGDDWDLLAPLFVEVPAEPVGEPPGEVPDDETGAVELVAIGPEAAPLCVAPPPPPPVLGLVGTAAGAAPGGWPAGPAEMPLSVPAPPPPPPPPPELDVAGGALGSGAPPSLGEGLVDESLPDSRGAGNAGISPPDWLTVVSVPVLLIGGTAACGDGDPDVPTEEFEVAPVVVVPLLVLGVLAFCPLAAVFTPLGDEFVAEFSLSGLGVGSGGDPLA